MRTLSIRLPNSLHNPTLQGILLRLYPLASELRIKFLLVNLLDDWE